ncbi:hypothetical protein [Caulobacter segnis]|uniref:hypothetical protein n=1 Tax=Caulobacter segnis TaxID=88688 RepID=UPI001CBEA096|nr:hypothetical protein [Caulobacter segnis]UAL10177.1 hypothetical protein K8940_20805 [Caulobacter segnis]
MRFLRPATALAAALLVLRAAPVLADPLDTADAPPAASAAGSIETLPEGEGQGPAAAAGGHEAAGSNQANNPLQPSLMLSAQDYYVPSFYGLPDRWANQGLIRGLMPQKTFGHVQLTRFTLPVATSPTFPGGHDTGIGDLTLMDLFMFKGKGLAYGVGPVLVAPTATNHMGTGKWQAGVAGAVVAPRAWGLAGTLVIYQTSFAGRENMPGVETLTAQPIVFYNLPKGYYLRSTGIWNFNLKTDDYYIPVGAGIGKVWSLRPKTKLNGFIEPQYTLFHDGVAPHWQIYSGLNLQILF